MFRIRNAVGLFKNFIILREIMPIAELKQNKKRLQTIILKTLQFQIYRRV